MKYTKEEAYKKMETLIYSNQKKFALEKDPKAEKFLREMNKLFNKLLNEDKIKLVEKGKGDINVPASDMYIKVRNKGAGVIRSPIIDFIERWHEETYYGGEKSL
jgi:hypothetical protein